MLKGPQTKTFLPMLATYVAAFLKEPSIPPNPDPFESNLARWEEYIGGYQENRTEAAKRIRECQQTQATELDLSKLNLGGLPPVIGSLTQLRTLNLSYNKLQSMPADLSQFSNLTELYLDHNCFTDVPGFVSQLSNLTTLNLADNWLQRLPDSIPSLTNLQTLDLSNNQLMSVPSDIGSLDRLRRLDLRNNWLSTSSLAALEALPSSCTIVLQER